MTTQQAKDGLLRSTTKKGQFSKSGYRFLVGISRQTMAEDPCCASMLASTGHQQNHAMPSQTATQENQATGVIPAAPWRVQAVSLFPDFKLAVTFCDGISGIVDCSSIQNSANPGIYTPLVTAEYFAKVRLELGVVTWPNGADLDPNWLHSELAGNKTWVIPF